MIGVDELLDWTKAEPEEIDNLKALERAAVAYISEPGGRYFGPSGTVTEQHTWRGGVILLNSEPLSDDYLEVEEWTGSGWEAVAEDAWFRDGRLLYLFGTTGERSFLGTAIRFRMSYQAGYDVHATDPDIWDAPEDIKQAVRMLVQHWYPQPKDSRETSAEYAAAIENILRKYR